MKYEYLLVFVVGCARACYWNAECSYRLFSSKTPYDSIRGDIRDYPVPQNCEAVSVWTLNRHGNRNPGSSVTEKAKNIASLKDEILASFNAGSGQLCAQDIDLFKKWTWNATLEESPSFLTGQGYEELYDIGSRIREKYPHLLRGTSDEYYFRPTDEQRTITSAMAFVHGLSEGTNQSLPIDSVREVENVVRPYQNCDRYQEEVKPSPLLDDQMAAYFANPEFVLVRNSVQQRLGINTILTAENIYTFYELCRFDRSWNEVLQSPWCAVFTNRDLEVLEYRDDVRHYYRNGYGSWVNGRLGGLPLKDMFEIFEGVLNGTSRKVTSYFTHDTMMEMVYCAMGIFKDANPLQASYRDPSRKWRTSHIGALSTNIIAVLNSCTTSGTEDYRVQLFVNEKETELCPVEGCTWSEFQEKFQHFKEANLEFCSMSYKADPLESAASGVAGARGSA